MKKVFIFLPLILFASILKVNVNKKHLTTGENLIITLTAKGQNVIFPKLNKIAGFQVIGTSTSNNITIINGKINETISKNYIIQPDKNITIPSFTVTIDNKIYKTEPIKITVSTPKQTKGDYEVNIKADKTNLYLGQNTLIKATVNLKKEADSVQIKIPNIEWGIIKSIFKKEQKGQLTYTFLLIPQKAGHYKLGPFIVTIGKETKEYPLGDPFFAITSMKYKTIYSNTIDFDINPIPKNSVYGDFSIKIKADTKVKANKPNSVTLFIKGCGDFNNIPEFHLNIPNATVYEKKPVIKTYIKHNQICGNYIKNFTILAENNYTIPSFRLNEFNKTLKTVKTPEIKVKVTNQYSKISPVKKEKNIKTSENRNYFYYITTLIGGIVIGVVITLLLKKENLYKKIKKANDKELFNLLISYKNDSQIHQILKKLEENIYKKANHKINKKEIIKILKRIKED